MLLREGGAVGSWPCHRQRGLLLRKLPGGRPAISGQIDKWHLLDVDGGTAVVLYRKDRVTCLRGEGHLEEHRLQPASKTRRLVAACCGTPMFLDFEPGYWLSIYRARMGGGAPSVNVKAHSGRFLLKLLTSWIAMGFRSPKMTWSRR
jgi:hypothetical protein